MSCHFISGKPGGGKSMLAMRMLCDELQRGRRAIVTNLAVKWEGLAVFLKQEGVELGNEHLRDRITILEEEQLREFYLYRGRGIVLRRVSVEGHCGRSGMTPEIGRVDYSKCEGGVMFLLDEVHIAFNARQWATTGRDVIYYLSQHRKLGDDVVLVSQAVENVDKQMRSMCQDFTYVRNFGKETMGLFRLPSLFMRQTYLVPAGPASRAMETHTFRLDVKGLGSCYDTAAGVGIIGRTGADSGQKGRGVHWAWALVVLVVGLTILFKVVPAAIGSFFGSRMALGATQNLGGVGVAPPPLKVAPGASQTATNAPAEPKRGRSVVTGCVTLNGCVRVFLSDGRTLSSERGEITHVSKDYVDAEGERYWFMPGPLASGHGLWPVLDGGSAR